MRFGSEEYVQAMRYTVAQLPPELQPRAFRAGAKAIAKHAGRLSKYDGRGNPQESFPPLKPDTGRIPNPNRRGNIK